MAACERCGTPFEVTHPMKRFCSGRCQRQSEKERYRARHTEEASCKRCGRVFERVVVGQRKKVYCSLECQYETRSEDYQRRPELRWQLDRARRIREAKRQGQAYGAGVFM
jgi:FPG/IleRS zinc finger protein